jgi:hypothetical protein
MPITTYLANKILDGVLRGPANWVRTSNLHYALFTERPNASGGGLEVSGGSYSRVLVTATVAARNFEMTLGANDNASLIPMGSNNHLYNAKVIAWPRPTQPWGQIVAYGIFDASTGGNLLWYDELPQATIIGVYQQPTFPVRSLEYALGGGAGAGLEQRVLNYLFRGVSMSVGALKMTLMTGSGSTALTILNEINPAMLITPNGRPPVPNATWSPATGAAITNAVAIDFDFTSSVANTGPSVSNFGIVTTGATVGANSSSSDEIFFFGDLAYSTPVPALAASTYTMPIGGLILQISV